MHFTATPQCVFFFSPYFPSKTWEWYSFTTEVAKLNIGARSDSNVPLTSSFVVIHAMCNLLWGFLYKQMPRLYKLSADKLNSCLYFGGKSCGCVTEKLISCVNKPLLPLVCSQMTSSEGGMALTSIESPESPVNQNSVKNNGRPAVWRVDLKSAANLVHPSQMKATLKDHLTWCGQVG